MNRSKIEWCDHTLNIVTGCRYGCNYCYARQMSRRFAGNVNRNKVETGHRKTKIVPRKEWIDKIVALADKYDVPVFMKDSLVPIMGEENMRRDFPEQLQKRKMSDKVRERLVGKCVMCNQELRKNEMITVTVRAKRGGKARSLCYVCRECLDRICDKYHLQMPDIE